MRLELLTFTAILRSTRSSKRRGKIEIYFLRHRSGLRPPAVQKVGSFHERVGSPAEFLVGVEATTPAAARSYSCSTRSVCFHELGVSLISEHQPSHFDNCFMGNQEGERSKLGFGAPAREEQTTRMVKRR